MSLALVWAQSPDGVIGVGNALPWRVPEDSAHFRALTSGHPVIMGRATWESLPDRFRPLPGRDNIVLTRTPGYEAPGAQVVGSLADALVVVGLREAWVIGGGAVYGQALELADRVEVTVVGLDVAGDTWAPRLDDDWELASREPAEGWSRSSVDDVPYRFESWRRVVRHEADAGL
ncbi:dihydrofolate reductase [Cellulomonas edaphi]|uniref:Dihydrofolate reductase n=1 Tax=Cellulomonas edaphi TaxID=3053468 RepID=A0ABT7S903_9CELL|nr:dihydrofolate reductase [Cellulomons edaphi]MDM7832091.1 dihydrofolate reductase [Cellulomons edaphi]